MSNCQPPLEKSRISMAIFHLSLKMCPGCKRQVKAGKNRATIYGSLTLCFATNILRLCYRWIFFFVAPFHMCVCHMSSNRIIIQLLPRTGNTRSAHNHKLNAHSVFSCNFCFFFFRVFRLVSRSLEQKTINFQNIFLFIPFHAV